METKPEKAKVERVLKGTVVAAKSAKTVAVIVERVFQHPEYQKTIRRKTKYLAHDEKTICKPGDIVAIKLVRPISKLKRWLVVEVIKTAGRGEVLHDSNAD
jgi:small subunit ribosomal protein S17